MFGKFTKIAIGLAAVAGVYAGASHLLKKYYEALGDESAEYDEGDELLEDADYEVPDPLAETPDSTEKEEAEKTASDGQ